MSARWYVVHVYSGFENKVAVDIREKAAKLKIAEKFEDIWIPSEEVIEVKRGQKVATDRKFYPGYVLVKMDLNDETWHLVKNTPRVTGFLGTKNKPSPISEKEAEKLIKQVKEGADRPRSTIAYEVGEQVRVLDGPFASFNGVVEEVDHDRERIKVSVSIFGRATPMELEYAQVEKVTD